MGPEPAQGACRRSHTVFGSSHLMSEMALTAAQLVVIGRGRLITDTTVEKFAARAGGTTVTVRTPQAARLRELRPTRQPPGSRRDGWLRRSGSS